MSKRAEKVIVAIPLAIIAIPLVLTVLALAFN